MYGVMHELGLEKIILYFLVRLKKRSKLKLFFFSIIIYLLHAFPTTRALPKQNQYVSAFAPKRIL